MLTITRRWGLTVPLETFIAAPTAAALAAIVRAGDTPAVFDPVVPLRIEGSGAPLFLVHPIGGSVLCYLDLVRRLPTGRPVYGLRAAGVDPGTEPLAGVEALAASYLAAVRRIQPEGPYLLAGWSFGGYVAFEMARQLPAACEVRVALLDTMILDDNRAAPVAERDRIAWFFGELLWHADGEVTGLDPTAATDAELFDTLLAQTIAMRHHRRRWCGPVDSASVRGVLRQFRCHGGLSAGPAGPGSAAAAGARRDARGAGGGTSTDRQQFSRSGQWLATADPGHIRGGRDTRRPPVDDAAAERRCGGRPARPGTRSSAGERTTHMSLDIRAELVRMLNEEMAIAPERIRDDAGLIGELGFDSIAFTMGIVAIEERLGVVVSTERLLDCRTFGDVVALVEAARIPA